MDFSQGNYNKWLRKGRIPTDKTYLAIVPVSTNDLVAQNLLKIGGVEQTPVHNPKTKIIFENASYEPIAEFDFNKNEEYPKINDKTPTDIKINGIPGFIATRYDDIASITEKYGLVESKFLKINDMTSNEKLIEGQVYYLKNKKSKAKIHYHVVLPGENAWSISQKYGISVKKLLTKNRMREEKDLSPGMVMWLRFIRPANVPVEYKETNVQNVVVKSFPNDIEYPQNTYPPIEMKDEVQDEHIFIDNKEKDSVENDFLFEEVNDDTEFIDEKSFVNTDDKTNKSVEAKIVEKPAVVNENIVKKEEIYHIVKSGETLFSISRTYGVSIGELRQWNNIDNLDVLNVGQRLLIKTDEKPLKSNENTGHSASYLTYTVKPADTLYGIARKYDITIQDLMEINEKQDFTIKEGEILKIKALN